MSAPARREAVQEAVSLGLSGRKACALLTISRSVFAYRLRLPQKDVAIIEVMHRLASSKPRWGHRRIRLLLAGGGIFMCREKALRLCRQAGLLVPRKRSCKKPASRQSDTPAVACNQVWAYDFVHDMCANGQKLKCFTIIDEYSREALAIDVSGSIRSSRVIEVLSRLISERGVPVALRSDNGPEFVSRQIREWAHSQGMKLQLIEPGKPWQNAYCESFNGRLRDECLSVEWFRNAREARVIIEQWRQEYNTTRPHSSLGDMSPSRFAAVFCEGISGRHGTCSRDISLGGSLARAAPPHHTQPRAILK